MARNKTARAAAEMKGVRLMALPLLSGVRVGDLKAGKQSYLFPNRIPFPDLSKRWLAEDAPLLWCPPEGPGRQQRFAWAINMLADPDDYSHALIWQDQMIAPEVPIFNHPRAVMQTRRDLSSRRLSGVSGLVVPLCVRFRADSLAAFEQTFADNAFRYPVLVRPCTTQNGRGQLRIDGPQDWDAALNSQWFGQPHYMVQFEDIQTAEGLYLKARVVFAGGQAFVRHVKTSTDWQVHNRASGRVSDDRELEIVDRLEASPVFRTLCDEVAARTRLDLCGMDVGVDPERERYVLFECNPAMSIFFAPRPDLTPEQVDRRNRLQAPLEQAVDALLRDPAGWAAARMGVQDLPTVRGAMTA
jgi:glutathione synthase/RimK-type ligase-like ATP-grasp enzyme